MAIIDLTGAEDDIVLFDRSALKRKKSCKDLPCWLIVLIGIIIFAVLCCAVYFVVKPSTNLENSGPDSGIRCYSCVSSNVEMKNPGLFYEKDCEAFPQHSVLCSKDEICVSSKLAVKNYTRFQRSCIHSQHRGCYNVLKPLNATHCFCAKDFCT